MSVANQYRLLIWLLIVGFISTLSHVFTLGLSWLWPVGFFMAFLISGYFYGSYMEREKAKEDGL